jgi:hypothetical protein
MFDTDKLVPGVFDGLLQIAVGKLDILFVVQMFPPLLFTIKSHLRLRD